MGICFESTELNGFFVRPFDQTLIAYHSLSIMSIIILFAHSKESIWYQKAWLVMQLFNNDID